MLKKIFYILGGIGLIAICIMAFTIPNNPYEMMKGVNFDYPIFLCIMVGGGTLYLIVLYAIYSLINKMYVKFLNKNNKVRNIK